MPEPTPGPTTTIDPSRWVDDYGDYLFRYAQSRLRDREAAEEVVQETFVAGLRNVRQYRGTGSERGWLLAILKRKIVDVYRKRRREAAVGGGEDEDDWCESLFDEKGSWRNDPRIFGRDPGEALEQQEFLGVLRDCLQGLPDRQADAFTLREMDGRTTEEICKDLEVTSSNLWVLLHRARLRLAQCIKARWQDEGGRA